MNRNQDPSTLYITAHCFGILMDRVLGEFKSRHNDIVINRVTQLYGFGSYDSSKPNLKDELSTLAGGFINGKYVYDKSRELQSGKPRIKLTGYYKNVLFRYIGYDNVTAFVTAEMSDQEEGQKQMTLIQKESDSSVYYYISYHFGENKEVVKGQVTVQNEWKTIKYKYIYFHKDGSIKEYDYHGVGTRRVDTIHIRVKTLLGNKMVEGGEDILYVAHTESGSSAFMLGMFSAFDIYNRLIVGKLIFEKCATKAEMIKRSTTRQTPAYIVQEIRNLRIENKGIVPNSIMELSSQSPYSITYQKIPGNYNLELIQNKFELGTFSFSIDADTFRIRPLTEGVVIKKDNLEIINNGSVIHFSFEITGVAMFSRLEVFFKTYYLNTEDGYINGVFSGLDIESRLISGEVKIKYEV